jgi:hypothetical protein
MEIQFIEGAEIMIIKVAVIVHLGICLGKVIWSEIRKK